MLLDPLHLVSVSLLQRVGMQIGESQYNQATKLQKCIILENVSAQDNMPLNMMLSLDHRQVITAGSSRFLAPKLPYFLALLLLWI